MPRLNDKTCIVTGAGRGIGAAIARAFAKEGAAVVTDKDEGSAAAVAREIGAEAMRLAVASGQDWEALTRKSLRSDKSCLPSKHVKPSPSS